jgi:transcriptional regulator with GAF, ATPase, and Fis domain
MLRHGRFEIADGGTLFLDEIGELPLEVQAKLLRVLQEGEFERLGSSSTRTTDIRLIAATHRDLEREVAAGTFRTDLFFRLGVFPVRIPPLRERPEDIAALTWFLIHRRQRALHRDIKIVPQSVIAALQDYDWPGNVRELENVVERALIRSTGDTLVLEERLGGTVRYSSQGGDGQTLDQVQRKHILEVLQACNWRINGAGNAAERLGLHPNTLRFRMQKLGIRRQPRAGREQGR